MDIGDLNKVWEIKALKRKPGEEEARKLLEKIAKQVQPIMKKHKWRVKLLSEFCPGNPALLGVNVGAGVQVKLRLRRPNRDLDFYPYDQILDTMLHELCHNAHGPHNSSFYKLWDDLRKECEELMTRGITGTGEGFDVPGKRLGGFSRQPPLSSIRQVALTAAEKRARVGSLLPHGPKRLGGDNNIMVALSPVQAAAMAAERRWQDDLWCGLESFGESGEEMSSSDIPQTSGSMAAPSANNSKQARGSESRSANSRLCKKRRLLNGDASDLSSKVGEESILVGVAAQASTSGSIENHRAADSFEDKVIWECGFCTLFNPPLAPICKACGSEKPKDVETKFKMWCCKFCTLENSSLLDKCEACAQWRYSYGPPMSTHTPNLAQMPPEEFAKVRAESTPEVIAKLNAEAIEELRAELMSPEGQAKMISDLRDVVIAEARTGQENPVVRTPRMNPELRDQIISPAVRAQVMDGWRGPEVMAEYGRALMMGKSVAEVKNEP